MALAPIHPEGPDIDSTLAPVQPEGLDVPAGGGGGGSPGGGSGDIQFNNAGAFGGATGFTFDPTGNGTLAFLTPTSFFRLDTLGNADLVGGSATQSGFSVGSDDSVIWGNTSLRFRLDLTGALEINLNPGVAGQTIISGGPGASIDWGTISGVLATPVASSGYQDVLFTVAKNGGDSTGLNNDATVYSASIDVDGVTNSVDVTGQDAQTFTTLLAEINADLSGAVATLVDGNIRVTSAATGATSTISIIDTGSLFSTLTDFRSIHGPVPGQTALGNTARWNGSAWVSTDLLRVIDDNNAIQIGPIVWYPSGAAPGAGIAIYAQGGGAVGDNDGGTIQIVAGFANGSGSGGGLDLLSGAGSGNAGAGSPTDVSPGGDINIASGPGFNDASGQINIEVGVPSVSTQDANGNIIRLKAGDGASAGGAATGGSLYALPGAEAGGGEYGNIVVGDPAVTIETRAGNFLYIPVTDDAPTGTPANEGFLVPITYDRNNKRIYVYDVDTAAWRFAATV